MLTSDASSPQNRTEQDPVWLQRMIKFLRKNQQKFEQHEHMQIVFNRAGDQVQADYTMKSIKLE